MRASAVAAAQATIASLRAAGEALGAWLDVLIRFWLAQAFLAGAAVDVMMAHPPAMAGDGPWTVGFNHLVASPLGVFIQILCPLLLLFGLFGRIAAVPMLIQALLLQDFHARSDIHLFWVALLGWFVVLGPGPIALDRLLGRGIDSTAVPGVARAGAWFDWTSRNIGPGYRLLLRLWIACAPLAAGLDAFHAGAFMHSGPRLPWLAVIPDGIGMLPPSLSLAVAILLILGLGTRGSALLLLALVPIGHVGMTLDDRLYWGLLLGLLVAREPGGLSLDHALVRAIASLDLNRPASAPHLPHVVIVGGGFAGISAAQGLRNTACRVTLVDRRNYHLFQPLLYQVATAGLSPADIATPIRFMVRDQPNVRVLLAEATGVLPASRELVLDHARLTYDYLIIATGSQHSYFGRDDWVEDAPGLKRIEDATEIRRRLLVAFERAESATDVDEREAWMTFVVVGGGPTGVELAGAIAELARHGLRREFRDIDPASAKVILVQSAPRLLPSFPEALSAEAARELKRLGVDVRLGGKVEALDGSGVVVNGIRVGARTVLWAAGVMASPAGLWLQAKIDRVGRIIVGPDLSVAPYAEIFAIGDTAASDGWKGNLVPGLAPAAKQAGRHVANVIKAQLSGRPGPKPFRYRHRGSLAAIGRQAAVADFGLLRFKGALAWWLWGAVHVLFLFGGRNRTTVMLEWVWAYFTYRRGSRLITGSPGD